jgi:chromosomal replication initiator protein
VDVLLMDDAQWIAGREATEEEFFHTFNWLHEANKQIVLTSDCAPQAMRRLHDRLRSRFAWGLIADIQTPDAAQRLDILRAKAQAQALDIADETLACLTQPACASVRELEGKLTRVVAYAHLLERPLDAALVAQALAPLGGASMATGDPTTAGPFDAPARRPVDAVAALEAVGRHFGVSVAALLGKSREHQVAWARQVAMYVLRETTSASLFQIGARLGGRDHTTIMHGCARVSQALASDPRLRADLAAIQRTMA